jgi:PAS domain S-box-containing protein
MAELPEPPGLSRMRPSEPKASILLVDDSPANLLSLRALLEELGQNLVEAQSGEEALRRVRADEFAVVLLDVLMPGIGGFETARLIRADERSRHTPVIFLTASVIDRSQMEQGYALGAVDFLVKPLLPVVLQSKVRGFVELFQDKQRARREAEQLRLLVHGTADHAIFMLDPEGHVVTWNSGAERIKGYKADEIIGQHFSRFYPREAIDRRWPEHELQVARAEGHFEDEGWRVRKDGSQFWANVVITALHDDAGRHLGFSKITRDLTERKRSEENARRLVEEAAARRAAEEFLATLAHELRNPLAPMRNALQVIQLAGSDPAAVGQAREMMERQMRHMVRLVDDLLDVSRITGGKLELRKQRVDLAAVVRTAVETSRPLIEAAGHELAVTLPPQPVFVDGDPVRLAQVFANLLNNAAKYTERGGKIWLTAERQGSDAVVSVRDTGLGIPGEMLGKVFELFTQVDRTLEKAQGGLGIGLTLVRRLTEMHGGSVEAHSEGYGHGSVFSVRLPAILVAPARNERAAEESTPSSRRRILVVDDNRDSAISLGMMLQLMGNEVRTAHDGLEAVQAAEDFRPDVALLDIGLPKLNGYEAARHMREQPWGRDIVLIAVTGWGQDEDKRRSKEAGLNFHMVKPVEPAALEKLLAGLLTPG